MYNIHHKKTLSSGLRVKAVNFQGHMTYLVLLQPFIHETNISMGHQLTVRELIYIYIYGTINLNNRYPLLHSQMVN